MRNVILSLLLFCTGCAVAKHAQEYSYIDIVNQLADLQRLAVLPEEGEKNAQFSGYDRRSRFDDKTGRYIDWDVNDDWAGYIRKEGENYVLAEMDGPGVIWRIWSAKTGPGNVKIFLDGKPEPAIDMPFADFFNGKQQPFTRAELVYTTKARGLNCYIPIPYQKSCKIVGDKNWPYQILPGKPLGVFYHFTYTTYPRGTKLPTFKLDLSEKEQLALDNVNSLLSQCGTDPVGKRKGQLVETKTITVHPNETVNVFKLHGSRAITSLKVIPNWQIPKDDYDTLRKLSLSIYWDNDILPAVWSPLGDFFGTTPGVNYYKSLPLGMTKKSFYSYWYMPFETKADIKLTNDGDISYSLTFEVTHAPLSRPIAQLGRFHAKWHRDVYLPLDKERRAIDWTMVKTQGRGRYCGVMLHVWHPRGGWWGEGDEKIYIDGEDFPSTFGTGSEDYFGYAWCIPSLFSNAFHNQTHSNQDPDQKPDPHEGNRGHISVNRWHIADNMAFQTSFDAAIEKYCSNKFPTLYAAIAYWYQAAGQIDPYPPVPVEQRIGYWKPLERAFKVENAIEGEKMEVLSKSAGNISMQDLGMYDEKWSDDKQLWWSGAQQGSILELGFDVEASGRYTVIGNFTKAIDYGIVQIYIDGQKTGSPLDLFNADVIPFRSTISGDIELDEGQHQLKIEVVGSNDLAVKSYMFGLDYLILTKNN